MRFRKSVIIPAMVAMLCGLFIGSMSGCASTAQAYKAADGLDETAYVMNQHFLALVREANTLAQSGQLAGTDLAKAQDIVKAARPVLAELSALAQAYTAAQNAETEEALTQAIAAAATQLSSLVNAIRAAGGSAHNGIPGLHFAGFTYFVMEV